eukprot:3371051-Rhodomonas_salina.1
MSGTDLCYAARRLRSRLCARPWTRTRRLRSASLRSRLHEREVTTRNAAIEAGPALSRSAWPR